MRLLKRSRDREHRPELGKALQEFERAVRELAATNRELDREVSKLREELNVEEVGAT